MNNISSLKPDECCGCTACYASCPTKAITMEPDKDEGYQYPVVDENKCIECGKCECVRTLSHIKKNSIYLPVGAKMTIYVQEVPLAVYSHCWQNKCWHTVARYAQ